MCPALTSSERCLQVVDHLVGHLGGGQPGQPAVLGVEPARLVDRRQHRQVVRLAEVEVLGAAARRDVHDPGALVHRHLVPADDAVLDAGARRQVVERPA